MVHNRKFLFFLSHFTGSLSSIKKGGGVETESLFLEDPLPFKRMDPVLYRNK